MKAGWYPTKSRHYSNLSTNPLPHTNASGYRSKKSQHNIQKIKPYHFSQWDNNFQRNGRDSGVKEKFIVDIYELFLYSVVGMVESEIEIQIYLLELKINGQETLTNIMIFWNEKCILLSGNRKS